MRAANNKRRVIGCALELASLGIDALEELRSVIDDGVQLRRRARIVGLQYKNAVKA